MGQAKRRGTLEQRQAEGIAKREAEEAARRAEEAAREAALTPEQRQRRAKAQQVLAMATGMIDPVTLAVARYAGMWRHR